MGYGVQVHQSGKASSVASNYSYSSNDSYRGSSGSASSSGSEGPVAYRDINSRTSTHPIELPRTGLTSSIEGGVAFAIPSGGNMVHEYCRADTVQHAPTPSYNNSNTNGYRR